MIAPDRPSIAVEIATAVAAARDEDVTSLPPLADVTDPEALEQFVEETTVPAEVTVRVYDCTVVVDSDGNVTATRNARP